MNLVKFFIKYISRKLRQITYEVLPMESVYTVFDGIQKILCMIETEMMDLVDFVVSLLVYMCNTFPNHNVFDILAR